MKYVYVLFHKPYGCLSQPTGEQGQKTAFDFQLPKDVYTVGRLDKDSEGLLLLTNNGRVQHLLSHPKYEHRKAYWVQLEGCIDDAAIQKLQSGVVIKGYTTKPCKVEKIVEPDIAPRTPPIRERKKCTYLLDKDNVNGREKPPSSSYDGTCWISNTAFDSGANREYKTRQSAYRGLEIYSRDRYRNEI